MLSIIKVLMRMMFGLMKRLLSNIKFREYLILLLIRNMLFQVRNHLKLLLVHFSKYGKKRILPKLQEFSSDEGSNMSCTDGSCSVPSKEQ